MRYVGSHVTYLLARVLLVAVFVFSGTTKLLDWQGGLAEMQSLGMPFPTVLLVVTIAVQIGASLMLVSGLFVGLSAFVLASFTVLATLIAHDFWNYAGFELIREATTALEHVSIIAGFVLVGMLHRQLCHD